MKKLLIMIMMLICVGSLNAQRNFEWNNVDSVPSKTKSQLYSDTKIFISEAWKSSKDVIQNDDKENGVIIVKGSYKSSVVFMMNTHEFWFQYTVKFLMKDGKVKIMIYDVKNISHTCSIYTWQTVQPSDNYTGGGNLPQKKSVELWGDLKNSLQTIVNNYLTYIKKESEVNQNW